MFKCMRWKKESEKGPAGATNRQEKRMRADEDKRLGELMDAFVSRSGSTSEERNAAQQRQFQLV